MIFKYSNESFLHFKGCTIKILNRDAFNCAYSPGFLRFRIFGYGMIIKDLSMHNKTLCDLRHKGNIISSWYFRFVKL